MEKQENKLVQMVSLADLHPYANNPRNNDSAVDAVALSIQTFGFLVPIVARPDGEILAGHTRYRAALKLGLTEVPVIYASDLDDVKARAFRLADNKVAELAEWDLESLKIELGEITGGGVDMGDFGFDLSGIDPIDNPEHSGENAPPDDEGINFKQQFAIIVPCENEDEQKSIYDKLTAMGYECKVVCN